MTLRPSAARFLDGYYFLVFAGSGVLDLPLVYILRMQSVFMS